MIHTPHYVQAMTDAEYKTWVERGKFPKRLEKLRAAERARQRKERADRRTAKAKKEGGT